MTQRRSKPLCQNCAPAAATPSPPSSDSESDSDGIKYQYESEGEERLGMTARNLLREADGDYRLARAAILAYTRDDVVYVSATPKSTQPRPTTSFHAPQPTRTRRSRRSISLSPSPSKSHSDRKAVGEALRTGLATPPPTVAPNPTARTPLRRTATSQPPADRGRGSDHFPFDPRKFVTLLYPHLRDEKMLHYFRNHDGVSRRTPEVVKYMLQQIKHDNHWLGDFSHVCGASEHHQLQQPSSEAVSNVWYAVTSGTRVGVFVDWLHAGPCVQKISGSLHKSYKRKWDVYAHYQHALILGTVRLLPGPVISYN